MSVVDEKLVFGYAEVMSQALTEQGGPKVLVVESFLACMMLASRFVAMLDQNYRDELVTVVEDEFRNDVEEMAAAPGAKTGVMKLQ